MVRSQAKGNRGIFGRQAFLLASLVFVAVASLAWIASNAGMSSGLRQGGMLPDSGGRSPALFPGGDARDPQDLDRLMGHYGKLVRNMSIRIQTAEQLLRQVQRDQAQRMLQVDAAASASNSAPVVAAAPPKDDDDDGEESDDARQKREDRAEKQQRDMIHYDEATRRLRPWRSDFQCGDRVPLLPDGEVVECDPKSDPCCSNLGWCGKTDEHCKCDTCIDYSNAAPTVSPPEARLTNEERECESAGPSLGDAATAEDCADLLLASKEACSRSFMFSRNYPSWGCRCCAVRTSAGSDLKPDWDVYVAVAAR